jgi:site-specific recombinase XerD
MANNNIQVFQEWGNNFTKIKEFAVKEGQYLKKTYKIYNNYIRQYNEYLEDNSCINNMDSVLTFFNEFKKKTDSANSHQLCKSGLKAGLLNIPEIKNDLRLRMIVNFAFKEELKASKPKEQIDRDSILTKEELNSIFKSTTPRVSALLQFCYSTGCRISEALNAKVKSVEKNGVVKIKIIGTKNKREHILVCDPKVFTLVEKVYQGKKYIFETESGKQIYAQNIYKSCTRKFIKDIIAKSRGITDTNDINKIKFTPHLLRHCRATHLLESGWDAKAVQTFLNHQDVSITLRLYAHTQIDSGKLQQQDEDSGVFDISQE